MKSTNKVRSNRKSRAKRRRPKARTKAIKNTGLDDDIKQEEKEAESMVININNESDEFKRETLKQFKFFQTKFSQRWTQTKLQQSNTMVLKDVGFSMKEFKILIHFVENSKLDLKFADGCKDVTQLRTVLNPFLLCNDLSRDNSTSIADFLTYL